MQFYQLGETFSEKGFIDDLMEAYRGALFNNDIPQGIVLANLRDLFAFMRSRSIQAEKNGHLSFSFRAQKPERIREAIIGAARAGFLLSPEKQEVYFECKQDGEFGAVRIDTVIGIKGYAQLVYSNPEVHFMASDAIYNIDHFVWNGEGKEPAFSSKDRTQTHNEKFVVGAFATVTFTTGFSISVYVDREELEQVRATQLIEAQARGITSPWEHYYSKMAQNMALRRLWRSHGLRISPKAYRSFGGESMTAREEDVSLDDFNKIIATLETADSDE